MKARDLIDKFGREEDAFLRTEFIAPVARRGKVRVRIAGMVCELNVRTRTEGWCVLRPKSHREAQVVREAGLADVRRYLELFPRARLVAVLKFGETWLGLPSATPEKGVVVNGLVPVTLAKNVQLFQTVVVRFDGTLFLFESVERSAEASHLRDALKKMTPPAGLGRSGLQAAEKEAYAMQLRLAEEMAKSADERRLERALELAGARLERFEDRNDAFTVTYLVEGVSYTSVISKRDLTVLSAGICLSDRDREFDLTSLVSVLRQHQREERDD